MVAESILSIGIHLHCAGMFVAIERCCVIGTILTFAPIGKSPACFGHIVAKRFPDILILCHCHGLLPPHHEGLAMSCNFAVAQGNCRGDHLFPDFSIVARPDGQSSLSR